MHFKRFSVSLIVGFFLIGMLCPLTIQLVSAGSSQTDINNAIEKGLAYLNSSQQPALVGRNWSPSNFPVASTALAVLAFENAPLNHFGWNLTDPYHVTVQSGLDWLFSQASVIPISSSNSAGNPDNNSNGFGIGWYSDGQTVYETPMVLMAILGSIAPTNITTSGPANVINRTYSNVAQDIVDWIAWAQNSVNSSGLYEGGWRYQPKYGDSDNSLSQWPVLGLMASQSWGLNVPPWVKAELIKWATADQILSGNYSTNAQYGSFDYQIGRGLGTPADTATGILELTYCGVDVTDPRMIAAEGYLVRDWNPNGLSPNGGDFGWNWNIGDLYDMYAVMKACRLTEMSGAPSQITFVENYTGYPSIEWYNGTGEYADSLLANQGPAHGWPNGTWNNWVNAAEGGDISFDLGTAWGSLILEYAVVTSHDIAVTNVTPESNWIYQGVLCDCNINVTIANTGTFNESFIVTVYAYNDTGGNFTVGTQSVTDMPRLSSLTLTFVWNTTGVPFRLYNITATAPLQLDLSPADNTLSSNVLVQVRIIGDVNGDGRVDLIDLTLVAQAYRSTFGQPNWNVACDINNDGKVSLADFVTVAVHYGQHFP